MKTLDRPMRQPEFSKDEVAGNFSAQRRPWRASVRVIESDNKITTVVLPGWNSEQPVKIATKAIPEPLRFSLKPDFRFFAEVNIGAEQESDLYFTEFEV